MLKLYTYPNLRPDLTEESVLWDNYFYHHKITKYFDDTDTAIVQAINPGAIVEPNLCFENNYPPIGIGLLAEGCASLLCINHAIKTNTVDQYLFNITSCGGNAISYLAEVMAKNIDINVIVYHGDFGTSDKVNIQIDDEKTYTDAITASSAYMKAQRFY